MTWLLAVALVLAVAAAVSGWLLVFYWRAEWRYAMGQAEKFGSIIEGDFERVARMIREEDREGLVRFLRSSRPSPADRSGRSKLLEEKGVER